MTRSDVAQKTGIPISRLSARERGVRVPVDSQTAKMAAFYGLGAGLVHRFVNIEWFTTKNTKVTKKTA